jgi:hypothetical protein
MQGIALVNRAAAIVVTWVLQLARNDRNARSLASLVFPLFPIEDRGVLPEDSPQVI